MVASLNIHSLSGDTWYPLPPRVRRKHGAYYLVHKHKWNPLGRVPSEAKKRFKELAESLGLPHVSTDFLRYLHASSMRRAQRKGTPFSLTFEDVVKMWNSSDGRCALTGIPFDEANLSRFSRRPWVPSLDRRDHSQGYTVENTRLICCAMNFALNQWGEENFERIAREFLARR